ncbi:MAG: phage tail tape measure protein, partial [Chloroflexota bacterium]|nr:phage tail tape measure protein [Chloroflexota bacterium]
MASVQKGFGGLGKAALAMGGVMATAFAGAKILGGVKSAIGSAADYEQVMNLLQASSEATGQQMDKLGDLTKALGSDLTLPGTSASDAAEAMLELNKAGLSVGDTMGAAKGVLQLSAAAQIGNAEAAEITAKALNAFKLQGEDAGTVANLLAGGANESAASIEELGFGMQAAATSFYQGGQSVTDLTAAMSLMSNAGIAGSDAGTSLKTMMAALTPSTDKAKEAMDALGVKTTDAKGNFLPMREIIAQMSPALGKLSEAQRAAAIETIFGSDASRAASVVLAGGVEQWDKMTTAVSKSGNAQNMAAAQMKGWKGAIEGFKSVWDTLTMTLAKPMLGPLTAALNGLSGWISANQARIEGFFTGIGERIRTMVAAFQNGGISGLLTEMFSQLGDIGGKLANLFNTFGPKVINSLSSMMLNVGSWISGTALPWLIQWFTGLARGGAEGMSSSSVWANAIADLWMVLKNNFVTIAPKLFELAKAAWGALGRAWDLVRPIFLEKLRGLGQSVLEWARTFGPSVLKWIITHWPTVMLTRWIYSQRESIIATLRSWVSAFTDWVQQVAPPLLARLQALVSQLLAWARAQRPGLVAQFQQWGQAAWGWVQRVTPVLLAQLGQVLVALGTWISGTALPAIRARLLQWGTEFSAWIGPAIVRLVEGLASMVVAFTNWFTGTAYPTIKARLAEWGQEFAAWVGPATVRLLEQLAILLAR